MANYFLRGVFFLQLLLLLSCSKPKEYEVVAKEYMEANYAGNVDKAKALCVPEAALLFDYKKLTYSQNPQFKELNNDATCQVRKSELVNSKTALVTLEENNVYLDNLSDESEPRLVETQETVINVVNRNNKWLVLIK
jgi:hypothetical protein